MTQDALELSVVVGLISGRKEDLRRCLSALEQQESPPPSEVLVPWDPPCREVTELAAEFPGVTFIEADLDTTHAREGYGREHHDTLRTLGLRAARGRIVALTEDHAVATPTWCADMVRLLSDHPKLGAIGGAVECGVDRVLHRAVYYCDFGRYQNPLPEGPAQFVSDSNVAYRREVLEAIQDVWKDDYHETVVHWALVEKGFELWLTPKSTVHQHRAGLRWSGALRERYVWGRSFAGTRVRGQSAWKRVVYSGFSLVLPLLLTYRIAAGVLRRRRGVGKFFLAFPVIMLLQGFWALGEFMGYATADPGKG